jgi:hypothetical protein
VLDLPGCRCAIEFVTRFHDCQAQLRSCELKLRDGSVDRLILVVLASHSNRRALALAGTLSRPPFRSTRARSWPRSEQDATRVLTGSC